ncbi:MAG: aminotransferase class I/II-fold pyridoxal phosphate-dependent enzyme [Gammaproteobacteria bacterium]|nr:aminotransferase class I/II-fold pyridoxal phosphate-dependent enzyme [Gammaproteobacteria bacterium]MDH5171452.1 aminotransferase class I/II-fold pyridoxal phosphate-dependent enzyme [Gammaproteobacteria bacterium]
MSGLEARPGVLRLAPYVQGKSSLAGVDSPIKLSSNESSQGPSPLAVQAYLHGAGTLNRYPDGSQRELREAIGQMHGLDPDLIICGNGSDELIQLMVRAYVGYGHEALLSENGFVMSNIHCIAQGADLVIAPEKDYRVDVDAMLARVTDRTRFCTIANPNNPTGTYITGDELRRLHAGLPGHCLFLIDDAYAEYVTAADYSDGADLVDEFDNVVMTRTFSKIYGLPSLRIGWAYCPAGVFDVVQRIRTPFNTNGPALAAAVAAVRDRDYMLAVRRENAAWRDRISARLTALGVEVIPSQANFYLIRFDEASGKSGAGAAAFLQSRGIIPRPAAGSDQYLRITIGLAEENEAVLQALGEYMGTHR